MEFTNFESEGIFILKNDLSNAEKIKKEYLTLLNKKMSLEKDARRFEREYIKVFGELIERLLQLQIECIKYKKLISIYYKMINNGRHFSRDAALRELSIELKTYYDELEYIQQTRKIDGRPISSHEMLKIKKLYKKIVNIIHPDVNPDLFSNEIIKDLWNQATEYYHCNDLKKLQEVYFLIIDELKKLNYDIEADIDIKDWETKLSNVKDEIEEIISTDPYLYKDILEDEECIVDQKDHFENEITDYEKYSQDLQMELSRMGIEINDYNIV